MGRLNNYFDIDMDGDSLINGIDVDIDADGVPKVDRDEGSDGRLDVNDPAYGGSLDDGECDCPCLSHQISCGIALAWLYGFPLSQASPAMVFHSSYHTPQGQIHSTPMARTMEKIQQHK